MTQDWNRETPLELAEPELIYREEIWAWIYSRTGNVAMGGKVRQNFFSSAVLEDWLGAFTRRCYWHLDVELSAVIMWFGIEGRIRGSTWMSSWWPESGRNPGVPFGENFSAVDVSGNVFDMDWQVLLLELVDAVYQRLRCLRPLVVIILAQSQHERLLL